ncbi:MAG: MFS transporter [Angustibacter sp.]
MSLPPVPDNVRERPRPQWVREHRRGGWFAVAAVCFGAFMGQLDASIVTIAYPDLSRDLAAPLGAVEWVSLAYLLTLAMLLLPAGRWSDAHGRKRLYLWGFVVFTLGSLACALAPGLGWLIAARVVQAVGAALLQANSVAIVTTSVARARTHAALGIQAGAQALGLALGPTLGGALVSAGGWRTVFWVNVPVGVLAYVVGTVFIPRTRHLRPTGRFDARGAVLLTVAAGALLAAASGISDAGWPLPVVAALAVVALAAAGLLALAERRVDEPLLDRVVLHAAGVRRGLGGALLAYLVLFGPLVLVPVELDRLGTGSLATGLLLSALPAGFAITALSAGVLPTRWSSRLRVRLGGAVATIGLLGVALLPLTTVWLPLGLLVTGLGVGLVTPANNASIMAATPPQAAGAAGGLINLARAFGTALGVAVVSLALTSVAGATGAQVAALVLAALALVLSASA